MSSPQKETWKLKSHTEMTLILSSPTHVHFDTVLSSRSFSVSIAFWRVRTCPTSAFLFEIWNANTVGRNPSTIRHIMFISCFCPTVLVQLISKPFWSLLASKLQSAPCWNPPVPWSSSTRASEWQKRVFADASKYNNNVIHAYIRLCYLPKA